MYQNQNKTAAKGLTYVDIYAVLPIMFVNIIRSPITNAYITRTILYIAVKRLTNASDDRVLNLLARDKPPPVVALGISMDSGETNYH